MLNHYSHFLGLTCLIIIGENKAQQRYLKKEYKISFVSKQKNIALLIISALTLGYLLLLHISIIDKIIINFDLVHNQSFDLFDKRFSHATVTRIIDGDTLVIATGERVRLLCIDAPELGEENSNQAKILLENLTLKKKILMVKDIRDKDQYDRLLRMLYVDGKNVNKEIVDNNLAIRKLYPPDTNLCDFK